MAKTLQKVSIAVLALSVFGFANAAQANLITNGSFEDTTNFVQTPQMRMTRYVIARGLDRHDRLDRSSTGSLAWIGPRNPFGLTASNGDYFLDLTDYTGCRSLWWCDAVHYDCRRATLSTDLRSRKLVNITGHSGFHLRHCGYGHEYLFQHLAGNE